MVAGEIEGLGTGPNSGIWKFKFSGRNQWYPVMNDHGGGRRGERRGRKGIVPCSICCSLSLSLSLSPQPISQFNYLIPEISSKFCWYFLFRMSAHTSNPALWGFLSCTHLRPCCQKMHSSPLLNSHSLKRHSIAQKQANRICRSCLSFAVRVQSWTTPQSFPSFLMKTESCQKTRRQTLKVYL